LDITSKEVLKDAVKAFDGTAIIVSHDRDFLNGLVDRVYEFADGSMRENLGGITGFLEKLKAGTETKESLRGNNDNEKGKAENSSGTPNNATPTTAEKPLPGKKLSYEEQKERKRLISKIQKKIDNAEAEIESLEAKKEEIELRLSKGESTAEILAEYESVSKSLDNAMSNWELAQEELDTFSTEL
jgi:ATP-binding cassette subfamily F protein 3